MNFNDTLRPISEILDIITRVDLVFGSSIDVKGKIMIPVSLIKCGFGSREGKNKHKIYMEDPHNEKGAVGGGFSNTPLGMFEITDENTSFKPVINFNHILKLIIIWMFISFFNKLLIKK